MAYELNIAFNAQIGAPKRESNIDFDAVNTYKVETCGLSAKPKTIPAFISGIIDLGLQEQEDARKVSNLTPEGEEALIAQHRAEGKETYFEDGIDPQTKKPCRFQRWPQKPVQMVAMTVDFPQIMLDMGQFFGESNVRPLRMLLNGEFTVQGTRVIGRPYAIKHVKHPDGTFAFAKNSTIHKMADAAELLDDNGYFYAKDLFKLVGKPLMFKVQVYLKEHNGKKYLQEDISFVSAVPEGLPVPEVSDELASQIFYGINFSDPDPKALKETRLAVKNTIKRATNYAGSKMQQVLESLEGGSNGGSSGNSSNTAKADAEPQKAVEAVPANVQGVVVDDDDAPF